MLLKKLNKIIENEGNLKEFKYKGYQCCIVRGPLGALNGYVALEKDDSLYGVKYDDIEVDVHGGLSLSEYFSNEKNIYLKLPKCCEDKWILGFDTAHANDLAPVHKQLGFATTNGIYRTMDYVEAELKKLVEQITKINIDNILEERSQKEGCCSKRTIPFFEIKGEVGLSNIRISVTEFENAFGYLKEVGLLDDEKSKKVEKLIQITATALSDKIKAVLKEENSKMGCEGTI